MFTFNKISKINGFDIKNPYNAKQNSYAWSIAELGDYIYIGTSRNLVGSVITNYGSHISIPSSLITGTDNCAEIWRYNKNNKSGWYKVFKTDIKDYAFGFRIMITHKSPCDNPAIYAVSTGSNLNIYKSYDGLKWRKLKTANILGNSSRAIASLNGKLYLATIDESSANKDAYLYVSSNPEKEPFKLITDTNNKCYDSSLNPKGAIDTLTIFNNKLYVGISTDNGAEIWRSNTSNPKLNQWTLVGNKGFGDIANSKIMSTGLYNNYLYAAITKPLPLALLVPLGFDLIRIDKNDNWELVTGGTPIVPVYCSKGIINKSLSGFNSGFNSPFNVYGWQIQEFKNNLIITTFKSSLNISVILKILKYNKGLYIKELGCQKYNKLIYLYTKLNTLINKYNYPHGFDIYSSKDGIHFNPVKLNGLCNPKNYGGRVMHVSNEDKLYIGTANPFEGCEVWEADYSCRKYPENYDKYYNYFYNLEQLNNELCKLYPSLIKLLPYLINQNLSFN